MLEKNWECGVESGFDVRIVIGLKKLLKAGCAKVIPMMLEVFNHSWLQNAKEAPNVLLGDMGHTRLKKIFVMNRLKKEAF